MKKTRLHSITSWVDPAHWKMQCFCVSSPENDFMGHFRDLGYIPVVSNTANVASWCRSWLVLKGKPSLRDSYHISAYSQMWKSRYLPVFYEKFGPQRDLWVVFHYMATAFCGHLPLTMANQTKQFGVEGIVLASRCNAFSIKRTTFWGLIGYALNAKLLGLISHS